MSTDLHELFSKNRSEESNDDNWAEFIVPPYFDGLDIKNQSKSLAVVGGRGCGKTTILRYFCHASQFSASRGSLPDDALSHIGLYWRADTNFLNGFVGCGQEDNVWRSAFEHVLACDLGVEFLDSILNLNCNDERKRHYGNLDALDFDEVRDYDPSLSRDIDSLRKDLRSRSRRLSAWVNNLESVSKPVFLPFPGFLATLIECVKANLPYLSQASYAVFIDEYENTRTEQQELINGLLKHSKKPLLFNIAMKRNGLHTTETIGPESIQQISDYRIIDLELELDDQKFELFAAELLFFRLSEKLESTFPNMPIDPSALRDVTRVEERYGDSNYRRQVIHVAEQLLPRVPAVQAATEILRDEPLRKRLEIRIDKALKKRGSELTSDCFIFEDLPGPSVITWALLNRDSENPDQLLQELKNEKQGKSTRFSSNGNLINNNLFGCVNAIYIDAQRDSILFSGFKTLTLVSRHNIRHTLELIHRIFKEHELNRQSQSEITVSPTTQASAMRLASEKILDDVSGGCGKLGPQLQNLAKSLGSLFRALHRSDRQSEPETNHFTLSHGDSNSELAPVIREAEKWSILYQQKETKMKSVGATDSDYVLNPIFSPFYQVSYRKKRSTQLSARDILIMSSGDQATRDALIRDLSTKSSALQPTADLFGEGSTPIPRTVLKRLKTSGLALPLFVSCEDYGIARCSQIYLL
ncbi:ATP-binding protein [Congregibacter litoralis]|uniref:Uncharacterized protein n=1 Tax=Congregibacter litoralis KT71 TaxID=314285 RepID=A4ACV8_9GAMM|nr:ATP-binding protein [Congregibacter litoralis]EAQ96149.2 hypothetical protein KT71_18826 [Congregibacter litoralis KT71]